MCHFARVHVVPLVHLHVILVPTLFSVNVPWGNMTILQLEKLKQEIPHSYLNYLCKISNLKAFFFLP